MTTGIGSPIAGALASGNLVGLIPALAPLPPPDLTVSMTDSGSGVFHPGDVGDTYTITVSNANSTATSGTVSLADALPAGLTATALSGSGWTTSLSPLTATCSNPLLGYSSYPALTLTVSVASGASGNVTNTATVSGGGETNTANDTASDTVAITPPADLTVGMTDSGNFKQGDAADAYTITVTNAGAGATAGTVSLVDTLPTGLTATALSGAGWTTNLSTLTATRSDALAAGASYPALTLTVSVAENAPASVTNTAVVSGGGETNAANDTASDTTSVAVVVPAVTSTNPSLTGGTVAAGATTLTITFSEAMSGARNRRELRTPQRRPRRAVQHVRRRHWPLGVAYSGDTATLTFSALTESVYRLTVKDTITNTAGVALEGNGAPGGNWASDFVVVSSGALLGGAATVSVGSTPDDVKAGDFNGDGILDLATANYAANSVSILLGNGSGGFTLNQTLTTDLNGPNALAVGDFNGDGKLDLAVANLGSANSNSTVTIFTGNGNGTFNLSSNVTVGREPDALAVGDFNGYPDLVVANYGSSGRHSSVQILLNNGTGGFTAKTAYTTNMDEPAAVAVGNFNPSGNLEVAVANQGNSEVAVLVGSSSGALSSAATVTSGISSPTSIAVADFNGDGHPDIVVGNYSTSGSTIGVLLNNGSGGFSSAADYSSGGAGAYGVAAADFNGDGYPDVVVTNYDSNTIGVLLNNDNGTFSAATLFNTGSGSGPFAVATGDFNGDGKPDVVVTNALHQRRGGPAERLRPRFGCPDHAERLHLQRRRRRVWNGRVRLRQRQRQLQRRSQRLEWLWPADGRGLPGQRRRGDIQPGGQRAEPHPELRHGRRPDRLSRSQRARHRRAGLRPHRRYVRQLHRVVDFDHGADHRQPRPECDDDALCHVRRRLDRRSGRSVDRHGRRRRAGDRHLHPRPAELAADLGDPHRRRPPMDL